MKHYYDPKKYEYAKEPHKFLMRKWHLDLGMAFPPASNTFYDDETRILTQGSYQVVVKTPPPWIGKSLGEWEPKKGITGSYTVRVPRNAITGEFLDHKPGGVINVVES